MEQAKNKHIEVAYDLFAIDESGRHLVERATAEKPFDFISGFGLTLKDFEQQLVGKEKGEAFDFTLSAADSYGDYEPERVLELPRDVFTVDGRFDRQRIYIDAIIPLQNQEGDRFMGRVLDIRDEVVVVDLNHPLAGKDLNFRGTIVESRPATDDEVQDLIRKLATGGCGGCEGCGDDCEGGEGCSGCGK